MCAAGCRTKEKARSFTTFGTGRFSGSFLVKNHGQSEQEREQLVEKQASLRNELKARSTLPSKLLLGSNLCVLVCVRLHRWLDSREKSAEVGNGTTRPRNK